MPSPVPPPQHTAGGQEPCSSCPATPQHPKPHHATQLHARPHCAPHEQGAHARKPVVTDSSPHTHPHLPTRPGPARPPAGDPHPAGSSAAAAASAPSCAASPEPRPAATATAKQSPRACAATRRGGRHLPAPAASGAGKWWWWCCPTRGPSQRGLCTACNRRAAER